MKFFLEDAPTYGYSHLTYHLIMMDDMSRLYEFSLKKDRHLMVDGTWGMRYSVDAAVDCVMFNTLEELIHYFGARYPELEKLI